MISHLRLKPTLKLICAKQKHQNNTDSRSARTSSLLDESSSDSNNRSPGPLSFSSFGPEELRPLAKQSHVQKLVKLEGKRYRAALNDTPGSAEA